MKAFRLLCALALIFPAAANAKTSLDSAVQDAVQPAYRFMEGISDGVYNFMRRHVICAILPDRLTRGLKAAPAGDSAPLFNRNLKEKESRFIDRVRTARPVANDAARWAAEEQVSVTIDSFRDTLTQRYQLGLFGRSSEAYVKDQRNWDAGFLTMAGLLGGTFFYLNGVHTTIPVGSFRLGVDLRSGLKMKQALRNENTAQRLAGFELGYKNNPVTIAAEWGSNAGRLRNERVGLNYRLRY